MPLIWNDETFNERCKKGYKILGVIFLPLWVLNFLVWFFMYENLSFEGIILISFLSSTTLYSFFDIFYQTPHPKIPDDYSKLGRTFMYIANFFLSLSIFLWLLHFYEVI